MFFKLFTFLKSFCMYLHALILLFVLLTNNKSYSFMNSVVKIVSFLLKILFSLFIELLLSVDFVNNL